MSVEVMAWVWRNGPTDPIERLVLLAIADHADNDGIAFPSMIGIATKSAMTDRGARAVVRRLEAGGWLETRVGGGRGGKSVYRVLMKETRNDVPTIDTETRNTKPGIPNPEYQTRNVTAENPERDDTKPGSYVPPNHHITIKEPSVREEPPLVAPLERKPDKARLPKDWALSDEGWAYARSKQIPDEDIADEARGFHAYWSDRTDGSARKSQRGWEQCWQGWVRRIAGRYGAGRRMAGAAGSRRHDAGGGIAGAVARRWAARQV